MFIHEVQRGHRIVTPSKRLGRGVGSGKGGKAARGQKGQKSRTGASILAVFEGGQTPFIQKMPKKKGFKPINKVVYTPINLGQLDAAFDDGATITLKDLVTKGLFQGGKTKVKLLGNGTLTKKFEIEVHAVSASAKEAIEKAKGSVTIVK